MGIQLHISKEDLKTRYKTLVKQYHPDVSELPNATELIQRLNVAFEILYDKVGSTSTPSMYQFFDVKRFANQNDFFADFFKRAFDDPQKQKDFKEAYYGHFEKDDGFNTPPPSEPRGWKRAASGNLWRRRLDITAIIIVDKKNPRFYKVMVINDNTTPATKKYPTDQFYSEEEAQIWAETYILGLD